MIGEKKQFILLFWLFCLPCYQVFSQAQTSKNNYTGAWEAPATWDPVWPVPMIVISGLIAPTITINGYITVDNSLLFNGNATNLIINDTLIIKGDLSLENNNDLTINDNGILIVWGNLKISNQSQIKADGYLIVAGNVYKDGTLNQGSWTSNDNPVKLFIRGTFPASLTHNVPNYPAVNCTSPVSTPYINTGCGYGNITDLAENSINVLLRNNCSITNVNTTLQTCFAGAINLTSSYGTTYKWNGPNGFTSTLKDPTIPYASPSMAGNYRITVTNAICTDTDTINVIVNPVPVTPTITASGPVTFCSGNSVTLTSSKGSFYIWSTDAQSESINVNVSGSYSVKVKNAYGCESASSAAAVVTVNTLPVVPSITASGPTAFCAGDSVILTSSAEKGYLWSTGATTKKINVKTAGSYTVLVTNSSGCRSVASAATNVFVNENPVGNAGQDQELKFISETEMRAELSSSETGEWSVLSGTGLFDDIHSPLSRVTDLSFGENIFLWKVRKGNCEDTAIVKIIVYDPFIPSVITPNGDGKNDYFVIGEIIDKVEIIIFNRWGNEEYSNSNYMNDWDGRNNKGRELPNDTYFYVLKFGNIKIKKGSVLIKR